jgi:hypothetical protein
MECFNGTWLRTVDSAVSSDISSCDGYRLDHTADLSDSEDGTSDLGSEWTLGLSVPNQSGDEENAHNCGRVVINLFDRAVLTVDDLGLSVVCWLMWSCLTFR